MTGSELRARREALGMTQAELARRLGVPQQHVSRWERGERGITRWLAAGIVALMAPLEAPRAAPESRDDVVAWEERRR